MIGFSVAPKKILIADDEYLIRWSLSEALQREGYEVLSVEDGKRAIEAIKETSFDFIITDLYMPETDGWAVLEAARKTLPEARIIILTAHGKEGFMELAAKKGAFAYVEKPFVIDKIKQLLPH